MWKFRNCQNRVIGTLPASFVDAPMTQWPDPDCQGDENREPLCKTGACLAAPSSSISISSLVIRAIQPASFIAAIAGWPGAMASCLVTRTVLGRFCESAGSIAAIGSCSGAQTAVNGWLHSGVRSFVAQWWSQWTLRHRRILLRESSHSPAPSFWSARRDTL